MREIKFRGKTSDGLWVYGGFYTWNDAALICQKDIWDTSPDITAIGVISETVGQFTGLLDRDGKEIYEGDILEFTDKWEWYRGTYWSKFLFSKTPKEYAEWQAKYDAEPMHRFAVEIPDIYRESESELHTYLAVVGNIHENPDLLTK